MINPLAELNAILPVVVYVELQDQDKFITVVAPIAILTENGY